MTVAGSTFAVNWMDERTSSTTAVRGRVLTWNAIQTAKLSSPSGTCSKNKCAFENQRVSYRYNADVVSGSPILEDPTSGLPVRAMVGVNFVPPQGDQTTVFVNQKGQVAVGLTSVSPEHGASNIAMSEAREPTYGLGVVEVSEKSHACRHSWPGSTTNPVAVPPAQEVCR
jgi:type IV pilus assembly protein PilY1